jgi:hypothetical protein
MMEDPEFFDVAAREGSRSSKVHVEMRTHYRTCSLCAFGAGTRLWPPLCQGGNAGERYMMEHVIDSDEWLPMWVHIHLSRRTGAKVGRIPEPPPEWLVESDANKESDVAQWQASAAGGAAAAKPW